MSVMSRLRTFRTAVLHQGGPVPAVGGVVKPPKPGGYRDSGADIAYNLQAAGQKVVLPVDKPDPWQDTDWTFSDTQSGILQAIEAGANVLWANTTLHSTHALVTLGNRLPANIKFVGQNPLDTEKYEDKAWVNTWLNDGPLKGKFPKSWLIEKGEEAKLTDQVELPAVLKPVRGRGSHGVTVAKTREELIAKATALWQEGETILVEAYCLDEEITVTVMPPGSYEKVGDKYKHWALPVVTRFNHVDGIAPYNGVIAVAANSRIVPPANHQDDHHYRDVQLWAEMVGDRLKTVAPIRIDCRRQVAGGPFYMFDVNMKPNATGPGRPGRDDQASLVLMAAEAIGWDFHGLLRNVLAQAQTVHGVIRL